MDRLLDLGSSEDEPGRRATEIQPRGRCSAETLAMIPPTRDKPVTLPRCTALWAIGFMGDRRSTTAPASLGASLLPLIRPAAKPASHRRVPSQRCVAGQIAKAFKI